MWQNWSGLERAHPRRDHAPAHTDDLVEAVERAQHRGGTVKMVGTGHSFTGIARAGDTLLRPHALAGIVAVDRAAGTVTVLAGTPLTVLNAELERHGLSLHNMGDVAEQTVAGAIATGTHGTGGRVASLSAQVEALELVTGTGEVRRLTREDDPAAFAAARVGLGALGLLTRVTFRVEPVFVLAAHERPLSWQELLTSHARLLREHDHVDAYWFPGTDRVMVKSNDRTDLTPDQAAPLSRPRTWLEDEFLGNTVFGLLNHLTNRAPALIPRVNRVSAQALSARSYSDVAHRVFTSPRRVVFREMEYALPREAGIVALAEVRRVIERRGLEATFPVEVRATPADDATLSTSSGRDSVYLAFHVHRDVDHREYFTAVEEVLVAHDGRPHWGKLHTRSHRELADLYPGFADFQAVRERFDPHRVFRNDYLDRVLGH